MHYKYIILIEGTSEDWQRSDNITMGVLTEGMADERQKPGNKWYEWLFGRVVFAIGVGGVLIALVAAGWIVVALATSSPEHLAWLSTDPAEAKWRGIQTIGYISSGIILLLGILVASRRAEAMEKSATAAHASNEQQTYNDAVKNLGAESDSVRLGGIYGLYDLAQSKPERRKNITEILCAHLRETTQAEDYQRDYSRGPSNEIASLLNVLCKLNEWNSRDVKLNLQKAYLQGADLINKNLQGADLSGAHLQEADFSYGAHLQGADLSGAHLQGAILFGAPLQRATLHKAQLQRADLSLAHLQGASLDSARLQGASLDGAHLQGADLADTHWEGTIAAEGLLLSHFGTEMPRIEALISERKGKDTELENAIFRGGLTADQIEEIRKGLTEAGVDADDLCDRLQRDHMGEPVYTPPSNITTGVLTEEMADRIIRNYNEAMKNSSANTWVLEYPSNPHHHT